MKPSVCVILVAAAALTVLADLVVAGLIATEHGHLVLALVMLSGFAWAWVCWAGSRWWAVLALASAASHFVGWAMVAGLDDRTFFGGAMFPVLSFWSWLLVAVLLTAVAVLRAIRANRRRTPYP